MISKILKFQIYIATFEHFYLICSVLSLFYLQIITIILAMKNFRALKCFETSPTKYFDKTFSVEDKNTAKCRRYTDFLEVRVPLWSTLVIEMNL